MRSTRVTAIAKTTLFSVILLAASLGAVAPASAATRNNCNGSNRPVLRYGDKGSCVQLAQKLLADRGAMSATPDGNFGPATKTATIQVQTDAGLTRDGIIGRNTWRVLDGSNPSSANSSATSAQNLPSSCIQTARTICIVKGSGSRAMLYAVADRQIVKSMPARTGDARGSKFVTTNGEHNVTFKSKNHVSSIYDAAMPNSIFFNGGQAVHYSADFDRCDYSRSCGQGGSSHGCVNIGDRADSEWLYNWARTTTDVIVTG